MTDDDPDDRWLAARTLSQTLASPQIEEIGDDGALEIALQDPGEPALAVTDYELNWSDGLTVSRRIKAVYPNCPVVLFTGSDASFTAESFTSGIDARVAKSERKRLGEVARALQGFVERHIVADDHYDGDVIQQVHPDERTPFSMGVGLILMLLSGIISITAMIMLLS